MRSPPGRAMGPRGAAGWRSSAFAAAIPGAARDMTQYHDEAPDLNDDNKNMILAIVLSALVLIGWSLVSDKLLPTAGPQTVRVEDGKAKPVPQPQADPAADRPQALRSRAVVLASTPRVRIET